MFRVREHYKYLRVVDVVDALDGIGYFNVGLVSPDIRPLWLGMRFWGVAFTLRCVPSNKPMWKLDTTRRGRATRTASGSARWAAARSASTAS